MRNHYNRGQQFKRREPLNKINHQISAPSVLVVDEKGDNLGVKTLTDALTLAGEKGLDLVQISEKDGVPVTRIVSYDKFRYQTKKAEKEKKKTNKTAELKGVRITPRAAKNDLDVKMKKLVSFLEEGDKVEVRLFLKGREKANKDFARGKLEEFLTSIPIEYRILTPIKYAGRGFVVQICKK